MEELHNSIWFRILVVSFVVIFFVTMAPVALADDSAPSDGIYYLVDRSLTVAGYTFSSNIDSVRFAFARDGSNWRVVWYSSVPFNSENRFFLDGQGYTADTGLSYSYTYRYWPTLNGDPSSDFYIFSSVASATSALRASSDSPPDPPLPASPGSFDLPCGNVAYIKVSGSEPVRISGTFLQYSNLSGSWSNMTVLYTSGVSLPSGSVSFPLSGMSPVPFSVSGGTNIFGQSQSGSAAIRGSNYICIYNPTWQQYGQGNNHDMNPTLSISHPAIQEIKIYPLSGSIVTGSGIVSGSDSSYDDYFDGTVDSETGEVVFTDQNGELANPVTGGTGYVPPDLNGQGLGAAIQQILQDIVNALNNVFSITHNAIAQLVASGRNFMASLSGLYSWLPPAVFGVLSSAVILVITIGILKVFL